jgi:hypothetical protein
VFPSYELGAKAIILDNNKNKIYTYRKQKQTPTSRSVTKTEPIKKDKRSEMTNYDKIYESITPWLESLDCSYEIRFLGRDWVVGPEGVVQLSGPLAHVHCKSVLVWYFTFGGQGTPSYEFVPLHSFSYGIFRWAARKCPLGSEEFRLRARELGAEPLRRERYSEVWLYMALPKIPVQLTYCEADDEFPASLDIKFSSNATSFLPFETLAVLNGLLATELTAAPAK